jgi:DNA-binding CsgD family transcriptional regulator
MRAATSLDLPEGDATLAKILARCKHESLEAPTSCGTASQLLGKAYEHETAIDQFKDRGVNDTLGINVRDPTPFGCILVGLLPKVKSLPRSESMRWTKVSAHIAAGFRLQRSKCAKKAISTDDADAIISASGKIEHAEPDAKGVEARDELRAAVLAIESARRKSADADEAVDMRKGLVSARWTLLEHFEAGGRRYFIARENAPVRNTPPLLTHRERQVLGYAALGHSDKLIAYELGVAWSTVRVLIARAAAKIGTTRREDTVRAFVAIARALKK